MPYTQGIRRGRCLGSLTIAVSGKLRASSVKIVLATLAGICAVAFAVAAPLLASPMARPATSPIAAKPRTSAGSPRKCCGA